MPIWPEVTPDAARAGAAVPEAAGTLPGAVLSRAATLRRSRAGGLFTHHA